LAQPLLLLTLQPADFSILLIYRIVLLRLQGQQLRLLGGSRGYALLCQAIQFTLTFLRNAIQPIALTLRFGVDV